MFAVNTLARTVFPRSAAVRVQVVPVAARISMHALTPQRSKCWVRSGAGFPDHVRVERQEHADLWRCKPLSVEERLSCGYRERSRSVSEVV